MHCEALQVFTKGMRGSEGERIRGGALGLGLLLGVATFAYAHRRGCRKAEILAIDDYGENSALAYDNRRTHGLTIPKILNALWVPPRSLPAEVTEGRV